MQLSAHALLCRAALTEREKVYTHDDRTKVNILIGIFVRSSTTLCLFQATKLRQ